MGSKERVTTRPGTPLPLGEFIATQRRAAEMSLRQLAERAGISNPYVSQIERGLRKPSAEVLQQLANALQVSAETLYEKAGFIDPDEPRLSPVQRVILADSELTGDQKKALIDVYLAFLAARDGQNPDPGPSAHADHPTHQPDEPAQPQE